MTDSTLTGAEAIAASQAAFAEAAKASQAEAKAKALAEAKAKAEAAKAPKAKAPAKGSKAPKAPAKAEAKAKALGAEAEAHRGKALQAKFTPKGEALRCMRIMGTVQCQNPRNYEPEAGKFTCNTHLAQYLRAKAKGQAHRLTWAKVAEAKASTVNQALWGIPKAQEAK